MRILVIGRYPPLHGGAEKHTEKIVERLCKRHLVTVLTPGGGKNEKKVSRNKKFGRIIIRIPTINSSVFLSNLTFFPLAFLYTFFFAENYDVIHIHYGIFRGLIGIICKIYRIPLIFTTHGFRNFGMYKHKKLVRRTLNMADKIVCVSKMLVNDFKEIGIPGKKLVYIPNGVDMTSYRKIKGTRIKKQYCFFGRLNKQKGIEYLLAAFEKIKGYKLVIIGRGEHEEELKKMAGENVIFKGYMEEEEMIKELKSSYAIVLPSLYEGMPLTVLEALASGRPVISTRVSGTEDIIKDGENGLLVPPKDASALFRAMKRIKNKRFAKRLSANGLKTAVKYDWDFITGEILRVYNEARR